jgi:hypothetical protein
MPDYELIKEMVDAIDDRGLGLSDWEKQFIASVKGHFKMKGYLSPKQIAHIEKIYEERTPDGKREPLRFNTITGLTPAQKRTERVRNEGFESQSKREGRWRDSYGDREDI